MSHVPTKVLKPLDDDYPRQICHECAVANGGEPRPSND